MVTIGENGVTESDILVHDAKEVDNTLHLMIAKLKYPLATGVIRSVNEGSFGERERELAASITAKAKFKSVDDLFMSGETYEVK